MRARLPLSGLVVGIMDLFAATYLITCNRQAALWGLSMGSLITLSLFFLSWALPNHYFIRKTRGWSALGPFVEGKMVTSMYNTFDIDYPLSTIIACQALKAGLTYYTCAVPMVSALAGWMLPLVILALLQEKKPAFL